MSQQPARSLSQRLARSVSLLVGGLWALSAMYGAWHAGGEAEELFDSALYESAWRLMDLASHEIHEHGRSENNRVQLLGSGPSNAGRTDVGYLMYQIVDSSGRVLLRSADAPEVPLKVLRKTGYSNTDSWRVYTAVHPTDPVVIHVADPLHHRRLAKIEIALGLWLPLLLVLPLLLLLVRSTMRTELRSVVDLAHQIGARDGAHLEPIAGEGLPLEVQSIKESTNRLLGRLGHALDTERALAANAAHELRTPLAVARLRLDAMRCHDLPVDARTELNHAIDALERLTRRAEKLLQMSRAESGAAQARDRVDLVQVAGAVAQEFWNDASTVARLRLEVPDHEDVIATGDFDAIAIALRNLIENALRYSQQSPVTIKVRPPAMLSVCDEGPGVSGEKLEQIAQRHQRGHHGPANTHGAPGYGLGLSIVSTIVHGLGGSVSFQSPPDGRTTGLRVDLDLRPWDAGNHLLRPS